MSTSGEIKQAVLDYLQTNVGGNTFSTIPNGVDLALLALNNARKFAERQHDFVYAQVNALVIVDPISGGDLRYCKVNDSFELLVDSGSSAVSVTVIAGVGIALPTGGLPTTILGYDTLTLTGTTIAGTFKIKTTTVDAVIYETIVADGTYTGTIVFKQKVPDYVPIKSIQTVYLDKRPIRFNDKKLIAARKIDIEERQPINFDDRYRSDNDESSLYSTTNQTLHRLFSYQFGTRIYLDPAPTTSKELTLDCHRWMPDYKTGSEVDFFTEHCGDYLMWASIVELNHLIEAFVPRQEGSMSPPDKMVKMTWDSMLEWDNAMVYNGQQPLMH